jgi:hypothetical protein
VRRALLAVAVLLATAGQAAAYGPPQLRLRELDVSDQPTGAWRALDGAQLHSAYGAELGVVLEKSGEHVLVEVTSVPAGSTPADQKEIYSLCFQQTGTVGEVVDLDQRIRYAGNGSYGIRMTVSDSSDASSACKTANPATADGTFGMEAHTAVRRIGASPIVLDSNDETPPFGGWAIDPPDLGHFPELQCALDGGSVTKSVPASRDSRVKGEPWVVDAASLPRPGVWSCTGHLLQSGALVESPRSAPTEPELIRDSWYGLYEPQVSGRRPQSVRLIAHGEKYYAGATVKLRLRRSRCGHKLGKPKVVKAKLSPAGKLVFRLHLPRLRRTQTGVIYRVFSTISGSRLIVSRKREEPPIAVTRDEGIFKTLTPCDNDPR